MNTLVESNRKSASSVFLLTVLWAVLFSATSSLVAIEKTHEDADDWAPEKKTRIYQKEGLLVVDCYEDESGLRLKKSLPESEGPTTVEFRMRTSGDWRADIYWTTPTMKKFGKDGHDYFKINHDGHWHEYKIQTSLTEGAEKLLIQPARFGKRAPMDWAVAEFDWIRVRDGKGKVIAEWNFGPEKAPEEPRPESVRMFRHRVIHMWHESDFAGLEKLAAHLRETGERFVNGTWKLSYFADAISPPDWEGQESFEGFFSKMKKWEAQSPKSFTRGVVLARGLVNHAWQARGGGYTDTVTKDGWKKFGDRLAVAKQRLDEAHEWGDGPDWYHIWLQWALGTLPDAADYVRTYNEAVKKWPSYYQFYYACAHHLLPRWYGSPGDWEAFAERAATEDDPAEGMAVYARVAMANAGSYDNLFHDSAISWTKMKQGFRDILKKYPDNENLNAFCKFAADAEDWETVRELAEKIGDHGLLLLWKTDEKYAEARRKAEQAKTEK